MKSSDAPADGPLDGADLAILDDVRAAFARADPMPADLAERIKFALLMHNLEDEVARLIEDESLQPLAARGVEQSRTITFDSASLTIMIRIESNANGTVRVDGWLAPPERRDIEMRTGSETLQAASDEQGRFAFPGVPSGTAQLVVRSALNRPDGRGRSVVTPALIL
jgi:hypothetical protein